MERFLAQEKDEKAAEGTAPVMLVVGNVRLWRSNGRQVPQMPGFHFVGFDDVTAGLLSELRPDVVLSALLGENFDALELARRLHALKFAGRYRALTNGLPNPGVVRAEVQAAVPDLDFDLFVIDDPDAPQDGADGRGTAGA